MRLPARRAFTQPATVSAGPYTWDRGKPTAHPGVLLRHTTSVVFIPAAQLRQIADLLHDTADHLEETTR